MAGQEGDRRGLGLAGRFKAALDARAAEARRARQDEARRKEEALAARKALLDDLAVFGRALGHAQVAVAQDRVAIGLGDRDLVFEADADPGTVRVSGPGLRDGWLIRLQPELDRWGLYPPHGAVRPLFDKGLEELLRRAFELRPADEAPPQSEATGPSGDERSSPSPSAAKRTL